MDINKAMEQTREEYSTGKKYETTYLNFKEDGIQGLDNKSTKPKKPTK